MRIEKDQIKTMCVAVVLLGLFVAFIWKPQRKEMAELEVSIEGSKATLGMNENSTAMLTSQYREVERLRGELEGSQRRVPSRDELADVLSGLTRALRENRLHEQEVLARPFIDYASYSVMPMVMDFSGNFPETFGVLRSIEQMSRLIRIDRLTVTEKPGKQEGEARLAIHMELSTFYSEH